MIIGIGREDDDEEGRELETAMSESEYVGWLVELLSSAGGYSSLGRVVFEVAAAAATAESMENVLLRGDCSLGVGGERFASVGTVGAAESLSSTSSKFGVKVM